ncbi:MAG: hypothetical protein ACNA8W_24235 [Bradymonadaceae bacterium]
MIAAVVFLVVEMVLVAMTGMSIWAPIQMMGAILLGTAVLPPPAAFAFGVFLAAMLVHFTLSIIYAFIVGALVKGRDLAVAIGIGLVFGLMLYIINFFIMTAFFPWFAEGRGWVNVIAHLVFGATAAWVYVRARGESYTGGTLEEQPT